MGYGWVYLSYDKGFQKAKKNDSRRQAEIFVMW